MPYGAGLSDHPLPTHAAADACQQVLDQLGPRPDLALLFITRPHVEAASEIAAFVRETLEPGIVVGASAVSVVGGSLEVEDRPAVSVWAARMDGVTPFHLTARRDGDRFHVEGFPPEVPDTAHTLLLLADPFTFPVDHLVALMAREHPQILVVGGLASAAAGAGGNRLILNSKILSQGAVGVLLSGETRVTSVVAQGCRPIGPPFVVTRAKGNLIYELAGRRAYDQLEAVIGGLSKEERALAAAELHLGRVIDEQQVNFARGDFLIRAVLGAEQQTGAVAVGDAVAVGSTVQFQVRDAESAHEDLVELMSGQAAHGALLFTCNGRGKHLFSEPSHDATVVSELLDSVPISGMFCAGEIGPVGNRSFVHGYTASVALFHDS